MSLVLTCIVGFSMSILNDKTSVTADHFENKERVICGMVNESTCVFEGSVDDFFLNRQLTIVDQTPDEIDDNTETENDERTLLAFHQKHRHTSVFQTVRFTISGILLTTFCLSICRALVFIFQSVFC